MNRISYCICWLAMTVACTPHKTPPVAPVRTTIADNSYMDLVPGKQIRIIVPLEGTTQAIQRAVANTDGKTVALHSHDVIGYRTIHYAIIGSRSGGVRLKFVSAETTIDRKSTPETQPPPLPFRLPRGTMHVRVAYMIRVSTADHNFAILAAKQIEALDSFTEEFKKDPRICLERGKVFCSWVPSEVGLRQE